MNYESIPVDGIVAILKAHWNINAVLSGADPEFSFFFWKGRKSLCARTRTHITSAEPNSLSVGVQGPL